MRISQSYPGPVSFRFVFRSLPRRGLAICFTKYSFALELSKTLAFESFQFCHLFLKAIAAPGETPVV
jgi:hypothetical protein